MDMTVLNQHDGRNRRSVSPKENIYTSMSLGVFSCAMVFVLFGTIISRKRPRFLRQSSNNNRNEGIL